MKFGITQSRNFTVEANSENEAISKMSNKWGEISSADIKNGIKLDTVTMTAYSLNNEDDTETEEESALGKLVNMVYEHEEKIKAMDKTITINFGDIHISDKADVDKICKAISEKLSKTISPVLR